MQERAIGVEDLMHVKACMLFRKAWIRCIATCGERGH